MILRKAQELILKFGYQKVTMTDIADACQISRTTLYKSYSNKESIVVGLINEALDSNIKETKELFIMEATFRAKLEAFFDIWTIQPADSVIRLDTGRDILMNVSSYAPDAVDNHYAVLQNMLSELIQSEMENDSDNSPDELAHIFTVASKGLKASAKNIDDLQRTIDSLISVIVAVVK